MIRPAGTAENGRTSARDAGALRGGAMATNAHPTAANRAADARPTTSTVDELPGAPLARVVATS